MDNTQDLEDFAKPDTNPELAEITEVANAIDKVFHSARNNGVSNDNLGKALDILSDQIFGNKKCCDNFEVSYSDVDLANSPDTE